MIHAVIFDMDGLMFDTERLTYRGYQKAADEMGFTFPLELFKQMCGLSVRKSQELFQKWFNKEFDFLQTDTICSAYVKSYLSRQPVCGDEVQKGKPNPEIFLTAAEKLHVAPKECLILEDSYNGIRAAHAAGAGACMVPDMCEPIPEISRLCSYICDDLLQVMDVLKKEK